MRPARFLFSDVLCCLLIFSPPFTSQVRHMIDKILPTEEASFYAAFDQRIEKMRSSLESKQTENCARQEESLKAVQWKDRRRRELEQSM